MSEEIYQIFTRIFALIEKLKYYQRYIRCSEDGIEVAIDRIFHKYEIKREVYHGSQINGVCVRRLMNDSEDIMHEIFILLKVAVEAVLLVKMPK